MKNLLLPGFLLMAVVLSSCSTKESTPPEPDRGFLHVDGTRIVDENGENVLLRGMGLGGWMLQEGYMLRVYGQGQQHKIRARIEALVGPERTQEFYDAWLANHMRRIDVDSMKAWGFNSVRLPMHYNLYTLPIEEEPVPGQQTWLEKGFAMTDSLLAWCEANELYLILDLHAAPGGQGHDNNISDRDPEKPSLWESEANRQKMVALWRKLAERYADEPWMGAYDILNEPNWGFEKPEEDPNGLQETKNEPLKELLVQTTEAIREVDTNHIIIIEGNGWGNNYRNMLPPWDDNMVISFHKYWNYNDVESIQHILDTREQYQTPVWLGETGENSNTWFTQAIGLFEEHNIGWSWWPLKKLGSNNPMEIKMPAGYQEILDFWRGEGPQPSPEEAYRALMQVAENARLENTFIHRDVIDAMFRQVRTTETRPFRKHTVPSSAAIPAVDYDLGRNGFAYADQDTANYYLSTGGDRQPWNHGRIYRNDGVDITTDVKGDYYINHIEAGEWLQYTVDVESTGAYSIDLEVAASESGGAISIMVDGETVAKGVTVPVTGGEESWKQVTIKNITLEAGSRKLRVYVDAGGFNLKTIRVY